MSDQATRAAAEVRVHSMLARINALWFPGAPFNGEVFRQFDERLAMDIAAGSIRRVKATCEKYEGWVSRKIMRARLERAAP